MTEAKNGQKKRQKTFICAKSALKLCTNKRASHVNHEK